MSASSSIAVRRITHSCCRARDHSARAPHHKRHFRARVHDQQLRAFGHSRQRGPRCVDRDGPGPRGASGQRCRELKPAWPAARPGPSASPVPCRPVCRRAALPTPSALRPAGPRWEQKRGRTPATQQRRPRRLHRCKGADQRRRGSHVRRSRRRPQSCGFRRLRRRGRRPAQGWPAESVAPPAPASAAAMCPGGLGVPPPIRPSPPEVSPCPAMAAA